MSLGGKPVPGLSEIREITLPENPTVEQVSHILVLFESAGVLESTALMRGLRALHNVLTAMNETPNAAGLAEAVYDSYILAQQTIPGFFGVTPWRDLPDGVRATTIRAFAAGLNRLQQSRDYQRFFGVIRQHDMDAARAQLIREGWTPPREEA